MKHSEWKEQVGIREIFIPSCDKADPDSNIFALTRKDEPLLFYFRGDAVLDKEGVQKLIDFLQEAMTQLTVADIESMAEELKHQPISKPLTLDEWIEIAPTSERRKKLLRRVVQEAMK